MVTDEKEIKIITDAIAHLEFACEICESYGKFDCEAEGYCHAPIVIRELASLLPKVELGE